MNIIVNADDLGMSPEVNEAIFALISNQRVTSSTLIANAPAFEAAVAQIDRYPQCSFGIHLNVTEFQPLTCNAALKDWLDEEENFRRENLDLPIRIPLMQAIFDEWCAQIEKARLHGVNISHIDSHDHVHIRKPQLFPCLKLIQKKYNINKVRVAKNIHSSNYPIRSKILHHKKKLYNYALRKIYPTITTSGFTEFASFLDVAKTEKPHHTSIELMVHPGHPDPLFVEEVSLLQSSWVDELPFKVKLINYHEL